MPHLKKKGRCKIY